MVEHPKSDRRRDDLYAAGLRKRVVNWSLHREAIGLPTMR
jgi:hypothetical protein